MQRGKADRRAVGEREQIAPFPLPDRGRKNRHFLRGSARWLLYLNGFDDAALKPHIPKEQREGKIALAWLGQLGFVYAKGNNLFETLLLNLVLLRPDHSLWGENCPAWERETPRSEELRVIPLPG